MKTMLHTVICKPVKDGCSWDIVYKGIGENGYVRVMNLLKEFPQTLVENYDRTPGHKRREVNFEYFAEEMEIDFQWQMTKDEFDRLMHPVDTSENYCGAVHFGDCKLEFVFEYCGNNLFVGFNNLYVYGKDDGYAKLNDGTPYSYEDDMFNLPTVDDFDKWKAECENRIIYSLNHDKSYLLRYALVPTKVKEWYPAKSSKSWFGHLEDACREIATRIIKNGKERFSFCESSQLEWDSYTPEDYEHFGAEWFGIKRIASVFDNNKDEYIVAVGYYGGGYVKTAYVMTEKLFIEENIQDLARQLCDIIESLVECGPQSVVFVTEEEEEK